MFWKNKPKSQGHREIRSLSRYIDHSPAFVRFRVLVTPTFVTRGFVSYDVFFQVYLLATLQENG